MAKIEKEGKTNCSYTQYTWPHSRFIQHLKTLAQNSKGSLEICDNFFVGEKENWTNKGTDKQYVANSFIHSATYHYHIVPHFKILSQVESEKTLTEKMLTDIYTNIVKRQKQYPPPLYILRMPGVQ